MIEERPLARDEDRGQAEEVLVEAPRSERMRRRMGRRLVWGGVGGLAVGVIAGSIVGAVAFEAGSTSFLMTTVGVTVFCLGIGLPIGGYSSLESPTPGNEPSEVERPITDRPELTRTESPIRPPAESGRADLPGQRRSG